MSCVQDYDAALQQDGSNLKALVWQGKMLHAAKRTEVGPFLRSDTLWPSLTVDSTEHLCHHHSCLAFLQRGQGCQTA